MKFSDIPKARLSELNQGLSSTTNLTEWLAVDQSLLLASVATSSSLKSLKQIQNELPEGSVPRQIAWIGRQVAKLENLTLLEKHPSDLVRCWACYGRANQAKDLKEALKAMRDFAEDSHFGIREIAWMAVRERICEDPDKAIKLLVPWTKEKNEYTRRFASEATRPRGVWAKHITSLRKNPKPARPLLEPLHNDPSKYVQDSVANWLNDAAKDNPAWVKSIVKDWAKQSSSKETQYIVKRATRSL